MHANAVVKSPNKWLHAVPSALVLRIRLFNPVLPRLSANGQAGGHGLNKKQAATD
jgi:hypothetical protein